MFLETFLATKAFHFLACSSNNFSAFSFKRLVSTSRTLFCFPFFTKRLFPNSPCSLRRRFSNPSIIFFCSLKNFPYSSRTCSRFSNQSFSTSRDLFCFSFFAKLRFLNYFWFLKHSFSTCFISSRIFLDSSFSSHRCLLGLVEVLSQQSSLFFLSDHLYLDLRK